MTEEDTFNKLKKASFHEAVALLYSNYHHSERAKLLKSIGWTNQEYRTEFNRNFPTIGHWAGYQENHLVE